MKYFKVLFCLILLLLVGIAGCSSKEEVTSINTVDVQKSLKSIAELMSEIILTFQLS